MRTMSAMAIVRTRYPILALSWVPPPRGLSGVTRENAGSVIICGGGGSARTGVTNNLDIYAVEFDERADSSPRLSPAETYNCGRYLLSHCDISPDGSRLAAGSDNGCWIFDLSPDRRSIKLRARFKTDFAEIESEQAVVRFGGDKSVILTGGQDGVVRTWDLSEDLSSQPTTHPALEFESIAPLPVASPPVGAYLVSEGIRITLRHQFTTHAGRIRDISVDGFSKDLVVSSSHNRKCLLWRLSDPDTILSHLDSAPQASRINSSTALSKQKGPARGPPVYQMRCVKFSPDGQSIYTLHSPARGMSYLTRWRPETPLQATKGEAWNWLPAHVTEASTNPAGSIAVSVDGKTVAVGSAQGVLAVFDGHTLARVQGVKPETHQFAVTGMSWIPVLPPSSTAGVQAHDDLNGSTLAQNELYLVSAGSADCTIVIQSTRNSKQGRTTALIPVFTTLIQLLLSLLLGGSAGLMSALPSAIVARNSWDCFRSPSLEMLGSYLLPSSMEDSCSAPLALIAVAISGVVTILLFLCTRSVGSVISRGVIANWFVSMFAIVAVLALPWFGRRVISARTVTNGSTLHSRSSIEDDDDEVEDLFEYILAVIAVGLGMVWLVIYAISKSVQ